MMYAPQASQWQHAAPVSYVPTTYAPAMGAAPAAYGQPAPAPYPTQSAPLQSMGGSFVQMPAPAPTYSAAPGVSRGFLSNIFGGCGWANSVQEAWDNHFEAFRKQDLEKIMKDYTEESVVRVYSSTDMKKTEFRGTAQIREMFVGLFRDLYDLKTLDAPVIDVESTPGQVFSVWMCPGCGYETTTDTFIFDSANHIIRQNTVVTKRALAGKKMKKNSKKKGCC
mmetsp:Transcript_23360/g.65135  ORF Transcript_23360/g.65135 Transcript_23360/m.65135 type:complete len:223 (-) Transcript_23360:151-819(-)